MRPARTRAARRVAAALPPSRPASGYAGRFYSGHGYSIFRSDCSAWTAAWLRAAGFAGSPPGVFYSGQVAGRLRGSRPAGAAT